MGKVHPLGDQAHTRLDEEKLRCHRVVARYLAEDPQRAMDVASSNLRRWLEASPDASSALAEWETILREWTPSQIIELITRDDEEGRRMRQSSPFVGLLSERERRKALGE